MAILRRAPCGPMVCPQFRLWAVIDQNPTGDDGVPRTTRSQESVTVPYRQR